MVFIFISSECIAFCFDCFSPLLELASFTCQLLYAAATDASSASAVCIYKYFIVSFNKLKLIFLYDDDQQQHHI